MKLSALSSDEALSVLCEAAGYITNIVTDEELMSTLRDCAVEGGAKTKAEQMAWLADKFSALFPVVFKKHKSDVFGLVAAINGSTAEEVAKQNVLKTMAQVRDMVKDKDLVDFFKSCALPEMSE